MALPTLDQLTGSTVFKEMPLEQKNATLDRWFGEAEGMENFGPNERKLAPLVREVETIKHVAAADPERRAELEASIPGVIDNFKRNTARKELTAALEQGGYLPSVTDALTTAKDKRLEVRDGKFVTPQVSQTSDEGLLDGIVGGVSGAVQSVAGRLGAQTDRLDPVLR